MFDVPIKKYVNNEHELYLKANEIPWVKVESEFGAFYSSKGRPSVPPRKVIGLLCLKERYNISDEKSLDIWLENPYWQYFCGEAYFQKEKPFAVSELSRFRKRIGERGLGRIKRLMTEHFGELEDRTYTRYTDRVKRSFWEKFWGS